MRLLLAGAALSIVLGSFTQLLLLNYPETYVRFRFWAVGSLQGRSWEVIGLVAPLTALGVVCALAMSRSLNAIALGADATMVGRAYLYGLMAGGERGVERAAQILEAEVRRTMQLLGVRRVDELGPHHVRLP